MSTLASVMITLNDRDFIQLALRSVLRFVDEAVVVDGGSKDGTLEAIDELEDERIKVIHNKWPGDYGRQRQVALNNATCDWVFQIDSDEVLCDSAGRYFQSAISSGSANCFNTRMEHFIRDFGHVDATHKEHWCLNRLARNNGNLHYSDRMHEVLRGFEGPVFNLDSRAVTYHLGYLRGIKTISEKYEKNVREGSHTPEFLKWWKDAHLQGNYPTRPFQIGELDSSIIKEAFNL